LDVEEPWMKSLGIIIISTILQDEVLGYEYIVVDF